MEYLMKTIKSNLDDYYGGNVLYQFGEEHPEGIEEVRKLLTQDYGYLDIVLDKDDLEQVLRGADNTNCDTKRFTLLDSLLRTIMNKAGEKTDDLYIYELDFKEGLKNAAAKANKDKCRVHIMLDYVTDIDLQVAINDLISNRWITVLGYFTKQISSYFTSSGDWLQFVHDYQMYETQEVKNKIQERVRKEIGRID